MDYILQNLPQLLEKTWEQIYLAGFATLIAIMIGVPLGIYARTHARLRSIILGTASIFQTIPSLALLALLIPLLGIGVKPAIVALTIYAFLPIIRNTVTGLEGIALELQEAADGLGFTRKQKLWMVELPLALPMIVAGIRTAMAMSIGIATLAAFIGAGGLGDFIYQGLSLNNTQLILMGAIPAALLALIFDFIIARIEKAIANKRYKVKKHKHRYIAAAFVVLIAIAWAVNVAYKEKNNTIHIGTKNFTEQIILGEMLAELISAKTDLHVVKDFNLGGTLFCQQALLKGDIDLYPEYTGTSYEVILHQHTLRDPAAVYAYVKQAYQNKFQLTWLKPLGFDNTNALLVRQKFAEKHKLATISQLKPMESRIKIAVPGDFMKRPDGYLGLIKTYGIKFDDIHIMAPSLLYSAIHNSKVDVIMGFSTDGRIKAYNLVALKDSKHLFPPYYAAVVIRDATLKKHPQLRQVINLLAGKINNKAMQQLNYDVDVKHQLPSVVARKFLLANNLIQSS